MGTAKAVEGFQSPRQERSRRTLGRIVAATESLLLERGPAGLTVEDVVRRADTSVGAFYTRFGSKDDAVAYVHARFWDEARERWSEFLAPARWADVPVDALVAEVIRRFCRLFLSSDSRARGLLRELVARRDEALLARIRALDADIAAMMARLLESRRDELDHPRPRAAAVAGFRRVISAVRDHLLVEDPADGAASRALILSLVQMYGNLLRSGSAPADYGALLERCASARRVG